MSKIIDFFRGTRKPLHERQGMRAELRIHAFEQKPKCENTDEERQYPVACLAKYISRIPLECNSLFPLPQHIKQFTKEILVLHRLVDESICDWIFHQEYFKECHFGCWLYESLCVSDGCVDTEEQLLESNGIAAVTKHKNVQNVEN